MKTSWICFCFGCYWLTGVAPCLGADTGILTFLDGNARLLRGTTWYKPVEGARVQQGDIIDAADGAQAQIELANGANLNLVGPAALYAVSLPSREGKPSAPANEFFLPRGWLKFATGPNARLRIRSALATIDATGAVAVLRGGDATAVFVESGSAKLTEPGKASEASARTLASGDFATRTADKQFASAGRAPQPFVAALPRHFMDNLYPRAAKFKTARADLVAEREVTYAEAEPWLASPYRAAFIKRFQPRLADAGFRAAVSANAQTYPEWSGVAAPRVELEKEKDKEKEKEKEKTAKVEQKAEKPTAEPEGFFQRLFGGQKKK